MDIRTALSGMTPAANKNNQANKISNGQTAESNDDSSAKTSTSQEKVTLTSIATRFAQVQMTVTNQQPEVNKDRVSELRKAIADGSYKVDASRLAGKMLSFESALSTR